MAKFAYFVIFHLKTIFFKFLISHIGCRHGQINKKNSLPKMQFKNDNFFNINT